MSWQLIPVDYASLALSDLQPAMLKAWLFNSLPKQHLYRCACVCVCVCVHVCVCVCVCACMCVCMHA